MKENNGNFQEKKTTEVKLVPNYKKGDKRPHVVYVVNYVSLKEDNMFQPVTQVRCYSDYPLAKKQYAYYIQCVADSISDVDEKNRFLSQYGEGNENHVFYSDILNGSKHILTLTRTKVQFPLVPEKKKHNKKDN